jgi:hypothetical protein
MNDGKWADCKRNYFGYVFPDKVNKWLSVAINKEVILLHSPLERLNDIPKKSAILRLDGD